MWERLFPGITGRQVIRRTLWTVGAVAIAFALVLAVPFSAIRTGSAA